MRQKHLITAVSILTLELAKIEFELAAGISCVSQVLIALQRYKFKKMITQTVRSWQTYG